MLCLMIHYVKYNIILFSYVNNDDICERRSKLIRRIHMECPICDKVHEIEERTQLAKIIIKGEEVNYVETYYLCPNSDEDENEFVTGKMMNDNLLNARNEYRKAHYLLT